MNDDLSTPLAIAALFEAARIVNLAADGKETVSSNDIGILRYLLVTFMQRVPGVVSSK